ncbi:MAG: orotate phosphoribosyltransferase [Nitrospiraceae bacterium]|nr:orotate phosphoribosyltransferase [Nitrospiraceae bacterium]
MSLRTQLAKRVFDVSNLRGKFLLRSGVMSNEYFDKYLFEGDPAILESIVLAMEDLIPPGADALAGLEMGGIPVATMLSHVTGLPALFIRKEAKEYGTCKLAEGGDIAGKTLVIVEDVVTSGGQIVLSAEELRQRGAAVACALCVIDREAGGRAKLAGHGIELRPVFTMRELKAAAGGRERGDHVS